MKKILSIATIMLAGIFSAQGQLVSSLDFSTGYNNVSGTALPLGVQDQNWSVVALTAPFTPAAAMPYGAFTQNPWSLGGTPPTTPANTRWISYNPTSMAVGPYDATGGVMTLRYTFDMCGADNIKFNAAVRSDNGILALRVDGTPTGFVQSPTSNNWNVGSTFSYSTALSAGTHTVEVDVKNYQSGNQNNPLGLNVSGTITSALGVIVDRDNYPSYSCCNADFRYCFGTKLYNIIDLSADDPSQPGAYDWYVNGSLVGSGTGFSWIAPGPGSYQVCLRITNQETGSVCEKCTWICIPDAVLTEGPHPAGKSGAPSLGVTDLKSDFSISKVYPNPANAEVNVELKSNGAAALTVKLCDMLGKVVSEQVVNGANGKATISTANVPAGIYLIQVTDGGNSVKEKIVIDK